MLASAAAGGGGALPAALAGLAPAAMLLMKRGIATSAARGSLAAVEKLFKEMELRCEGASMGRRRRAKLWRYRQ